MARSRKPTNLHVVQGTLRADRHGDRLHEPRVAEPLGGPPAHLADPDLRAIWGELAGILPAGVAMASDRVAFELFVRLVGRMRLAGGLSAAEMAQLRGLLASFGLTPADRSRVSAPADDADDPLARYTG